MAVAGYIFFRDVNKGRFKKIDACLSLHACDKINGNLRA